MLKDNPRLTELRTAIILNNIANMTDRVKVNNILYVLKSYVMTIDNEYGDLFNNVLSASINEQLLAADKKEICLTMQVNYESEREIMKRLGVSYNIYHSLYPNMKKYTTEEYVNGLEARFAIFNNYFVMCKLVGDMYDNFEMTSFSNEHKYHDLPRTTEFRFMYLYTKLKDYFMSEELTNQFIITLCRNLKIDTDIINELLASKHLIYKLSETNITSNLSLTKELITYGYIEQWSKGKISTELLGKEKTYLAGKTSINKDDTDNDYFIYKFYKPTVLKDDRAVYEVQKFIKVMSDFNER